jgi:uncharacterized repeat protein (TIGR03803 family)
VFQITAGGVFTTLHQFSGTEGSHGIVTVKNGANFIGTTTDGGSNGFGAAFEMTAAGTLTTFYQFSGTNGVMDGSSPGLEPITDSAGAYYGVDQDGGTNSEGLIFTLTTSGTLTRVYEFCSVTNCADGTAPDGFISSGGALYGTTDNGGANGNGGTVYKLIPAGGIGGGGGGGGCTFALGTDSGTFTAAGGASTVSVLTSNSCDWTATNNDSFITITSGSSGSGNGTVHYSVAANTSSNGLTGTMTIAGQTFTVTQSGAAAETCAFTLSAKSVTVPSKGGAKKVSVKVKGTDCSWTATTTNDFITIVTGASGSGNGTVDFTVPGNTNTTARSGTITIAGETFTVNQAAGGCTFTLSPKSGKLKAAGGSATVKVKANLSDCPWTAVSNDAFITITAGASGVGNGTVNYTVEANTNTTVVTGTITIGGQTFTVTETGAK